MKEKIQILKTPEIFTREYREFKTEDRILQEIVNSFTAILENNIERNNLKLFYNNIGTLKVENRSVILNIILDMFKDTTTTGQYYLEDNIISILPLKNKNFLSKCIGISTQEYIANLFHELLHMSSTIVDKDGMVFSGFSQIGEIGIGIALDDAYTEMLLYRYFGLNKEYMSYDYEVIVTCLIEEIVEKNEMINLYFGADLYGLVKELEKYNTRENIEKFLEDLDSIYALRDRSRKYKKDIIYYHNEISEFLVNTYLNKLNKDIEDGKIAKDVYDTKLDRFLVNIHIAFEKLETQEKKIRIRNNDS